MTGHVGKYIFKIDLFLSCPCKNAVHLLNQDVNQKKDDGLLKNNQLQNLTLVFSPEACQTKVLDNCCNIWVGLGYAVGVNGLTHIPQKVFMAYITIRMKLRSDAVDL